MSAFSERRRLPLSLAETLFHPGERAARSPPCEIKVDSKTPGRGGGRPSTRFWLAFTYTGPGVSHLYVCLSFWPSILEKYYW